MKKFYIALAASLTLGFSSCIEETLPTDHVLGSQLAASESAIDGMVNSIYTNMVGYSNSDGGIEVISYGSMRAQLEHGTTPMVCTGANGYNTMGNWHYGTIPATGSNRGIYPSYLYYGYIKTVNDIIGLINPEDMTEGQKRNLGICYAYRALYYMDLVSIMEFKYPTDPKVQAVFVQPENDLTNLGVPIVTEKTTSEEASNNPRATVDEVYDLILSDLAKAEEYLEGFVPSDIIQPSTPVVYGLYAKAYANLACRVNTAAKYKDAATYWKNAYEYADKAITSSGRTPLTEAQWTDPINGFNNRTSQNSWMWATTISPSNTDAMSQSFYFSMIFGTETTFSAYGWRVGRSLDRKMYEKLSDNDWRKKSWLHPSFFYESKDQKEGEPYLVKKDANGNWDFSDNKWGSDGNWSDDFNSFDEDRYDYKLSSSASWIRGRITKGNGFLAWPWLYVNIKFRPAGGVYDNRLEGAATDYPIMRVEEMHFLKAEAALHCKGVETANGLLEDIVKTRNAEYTCDAATEEEFMEQYNFQKQVEFWGEGINYFDAKRLELGIHRGYKGTSCERYQQALVVEGVHLGWTPGWNQAELNANQAIYHYNNSYTNPNTYYFYKSNDEMRPFYGEPLED